MKDKKIFTMEIHPAIKQNWIADTYGLYRSNLSLRLRGVDPRMVLKPETVETVIQSYKDLIEELKVSITQAEELKKEMLSNSQKVAA